MSASLARASLVAVLGVACFDPRSALGPHDSGAGGAGGVGTGAGGSGSGGAGGSGGGGADAGGTDAGTGASDGGGGADGPGADACAALTCDDAHLCVAGACASRYTQLPLPEDRYPGVDIVTVGPDGNLWFLAVSRGSIGRLTPGGDMTLYPLPIGHFSAAGLTAGPDGNLWFTESIPNRVGCLTTGGAYIKSFDVPTAMASPGAITAGPDGNLWFTELRGDRVARMTVDGAITEFALRAGVLPYLIVGGPGGDVWFYEQQDSSVPSDPSSLARITHDGVMTELPMEGVGDMTAGPDGNLWLCVGVPTPRIVRVTPGGDVRAFVIPEPIINCRAITFGPDGNVWFTEDEYNRSGVVRMTPAGDFREITFPDPGFSAYGLNSIAAGPGGDIWFTELYKSAIGRVVPW